MDAVNQALLIALAPKYAKGEMAWAEIADKTGAAFGDMLIALAKLGLKLPVCQAERRPEQTAIFHEVLRRAAQNR